MSPTLGYYILDLNPSTVSAETALVVSLFQVASLLGKKENFSPIRICIRMVILKGVGFGTPVTSSLRQVPFLVNNDSIIVYFIEGQTPAVSVSGVLAISPIRLRLGPARSYPVDLLYSINFCSVMGVPYAAYS